MNEMTNKSKESNKLKLTNQEKIILEYLNDHHELNDEIIQNLVNVKRSRALAIIRMMSEKGLLKIVGRGKNKKTSP